MAKQRVRDNNDLVIGGAGADGHGVMCGFGGDGPLTREVFVDLLRRSGIDESWFPATKDAKVQLTRAMRTVGGSRGLSAEQEKKKGRQVVEEREPSSRWMLVSGGGTASESRRPGDAWGEIALVATLYDDERGQSLEFEPVESPLALAVKEEFDRLTGAQLYQAADITGWLNHIHRDLLSGVRIGWGWYVPREHRVLAEQIAETFWNEEHYGQNWTYPPLPVATSAQLQKGIAFGLAAEVDEQLALLEGQRRKLRTAKAGYDKSGKLVELSKLGEYASLHYAYDDQGEFVDIGARAAESFAIRFARVGRRVDAYADTLGDELVSYCKQRIHDAMTEIDSILEGGATKDDGTFRDLLAETEAREEAEEAAEEAKAAAEQLGMSVCEQRVRDALTTWWTYERSNEDNKTKRDIGPLARAMGVAKYNPANDAIEWRGTIKSCMQIFQLVDY